jgi:hypothetical protein
VLLERKPVQIPDVLADPEYSNLEPQRLGGYRTHLWASLFVRVGPGHSPSIHAFICV